MTRTARAAYPRAVIKDRSESRSGLDTSLRKSGAGRHNWGGLADEQQLENQAMEDEEEELETENLVPEETTATGSSRSLSPPAKPDMNRASSALSVEDLEAARKVRKNALKKADAGVIDLSAIARTSAAVSGSPPASPVERRPNH